MGKKKDGGQTNPVDAFRKTQRSKEVARNKKERQLYKEARRYDAATLRNQLKEVIAEEEAGPGSANSRMRKKALQEAYDNAIKKGMERKNAASMEEPSLHQVPDQNALPPLPGRFQNTVNSHGHDVVQILAYQSPDSRSCTAAPAIPVIAEPATLPPPREPQSAEHASTIVGKTTVVPLPKAQQDRNLTSMIPASVLVSRQGAKNVKRKPVDRFVPQSFGLMPAQMTAHSKPETSEARPADREGKSSQAHGDDYLQFLESMKELGAF